MIMRANTPRSLTWPGCLAVVALGLSFLPMLPAQSPTSSREEDPKDEINKPLDRDRSGTQIDAIKAELEKLEAELQQKRADLAAARARLRAAAAAERGRQKLESDDKAQKAREKVIVARALQDIREEPNAAKGKKVMIRIALVVGEDINPKDLTKKLLSVLPKGSTIQIDDLIRVIGSDKKEDGPRLIIKEGNKILELPPRGAGPVPPPMKAPPGTPGSAQDKRINDLERKLEKVLQELQEMRKQMRQPRGRPVPAAPPAADESSSDNNPFQPGNVAVPPPPPTPAAAPRPPARVPPPPQPAPPAPPADPAGP